MSSAYHSRLSSQQPCCVSLCLTWQELPREFTKTTLVSRCWRLDRPERHPNDLVLVEGGAAVLPRLSAGSVLMDSCENEAPCCFLLGRVSAVSCSCETRYTLQMKEPTDLAPLQQECWSSSELSWRRGTRTALCCGLTSFCSQSAKLRAGKYKLLMLRAQKRRNSLHRSGLVLLVAYCHGAIRETTHVSKISPFQNKRGP